MKLFSLFIFLVLCNWLAAQTPLYNDTTNVLRAETSVLISSSDDIPFWHMHNQRGIYFGNSSNFQTVSILAHQIKPLGDSKFKAHYGTYLIAGNSDQIYFQANELYAGIQFRNWILKAGMYGDRERFGGLSTSNGNLYRSLNARPYPKIGIATNGYVHLPFAKKWLTASVEYDEGLLDDERYFIEAPHFHHKSVYAKALLEEYGWSLTLGLEHFVMWAGTSPDPSVGVQPSSFKAYLYYITGTQNDLEGSTASDQANVPGNQFGTYQAELTKEFDRLDAKFYFSHPFEDLSGVNWRNWPDKLYGVELKNKNKNAFCTHLVYEFTYSMHQGIRDTSLYWDEGTQRWLKRHADNYFTHGEYKSGATYHKMALGSPLFAPIGIVNDVSRGTQNTLLVSHHIGGKGNINSILAWKTMLSYTHYEGKYWQRSIPSENQFSCLFEFNYHGRKLPFEVYFSLAADAGDLYDNRVGGMLKLSKSW